MGNTILLADKSITIQKIVELTFADENYVIRSVSDGPGALQALSQIRPDLILADISLPVKNGYDLCRAIRTEPQYAEFSGIPVILLAGIYETMDEERIKQVEETVREVRANDYLSKPFDPQILVTKVKEFMEQQRVSAQPSAADAAAETFVVAASHASSDFITDEPYDEEKTLVLPQSPFASNLFAEASPFDKETVAEPGRTASVNIEMIKPVDEPVFDPEEMQEPAGEEQDEVDELAYDEDDSGPLYSLPEDEVDDTGKMARESQQDPEANGSAAAVIVAGEEPFGEVYQQPVAAAWGAITSSSDDDSPFGEPEPPPAETMPETMEPETVAAEVAQAAEPSVEQDVPEELSEPVAEEPPAYDDTWPGVNLEAGAQPVEELFESDATEEEEQMEMAVSDITEEDVVDSEAAEEPEVAAPVAPMNDEFIDKVVEKVLARMSERLVSEIVWQVVPDLAEKMIRRELEKLHEAEE